VAFDGHVSPISSFPHAVRDRCGVVQLRARPSAKLAALFAIRGVVRRPNTPTMRPARALPKSKSIRRLFTLLLRRNIRLAARAASGLCAVACRSSPLTARTKSLGRDCAHGFEVSLSRVAAGKSPVSVWRKLNRSACSNGVSLMWLLKAGSSVPTPPSPPPAL
jgi:hypothetical protein